MWKIGIGGLGPSTLEKVLSPMAAVGFLRSLWKKPIWAKLRSDGQCVFAHSVHGMECANGSMAWRALFLPDPRREPAIARTVDLQILTSAPTFSPADVLKTCAIALHMVAEGRGGEISHPRAGRRMENMLLKKSEGEVGRRKCVFLWLS